MTHDPDCPNRPSWLADHRWQVAGWVSVAASIALQVWLLLQWAPWPYVLVALALVGVQSWIMGRSYGRQEGLARCVEIIHGVMAAHEEAEEPGRRLQRGWYHFGHFHPPGDEAHEHPLPPMTPSERGKRD